MPSNMQFTDYASPSDEWALIEVSQLQANVSLTNNSSGSHTVGTSTVTVQRAPNDTLLPSPGNAVDFYDGWFEYPIDSDGSLPDVQVTFEIGQKSLGTVNLSAGYHRNMFANPDRVYGGRKNRVPYAVSMRSLYNQLKKGAKVRNLPLQMVGLKIPSQEPLKITFKSTMGWGQSGTAIRPLRFHLLADVWTDPQLADFQSLYDGSYRITRAPSGTVQGTHTLNAALTSKNIDILPGGLNQSGTKIQRRILWATNNKAIGTGSAYQFTNQPAAGGQQNNVSDAEYDLGFPYKESSQVFIPYNIGFDFDPSLLGAGSNPQIYVGWWNATQRTMLPDMYTQGLLISGQRNPFQYGATTPQINDRSQQFPLPDAKNLLSLIVRGDGWSPAVSAMTLSGFAANTIYAMVGGIDIG